jgi:hypothetical protein
MQENIYRQAGSPEVDAAWEALGVDCESPSMRSHNRASTDTQQIVQGPYQRKMVLQVASTTLSYSGTRSTGPAFSLTWRACITCTAWYALATLDW